VIDAICKMPFDAVRALVNVTTTEQALRIVILVLAIDYGSLRSFGSCFDALRLKRGPSVNSMMGTTAVALSNANVHVIVFQPAAF